MRGVLDQLEHRGARHHRPGCDREVVADGVGVGSTIAGTRGLVAMSRANARAPRSADRPPVSMSALNPSGLSSGLLLGARPARGCRARTASVRRRASPGRPRRAGHTRCPRWPGRPACCGAAAGCAATPGRRTACRPCRVRGRRGRPRRRRVPGPGRRRGARPCAGGPPARRRAAPRIGWAASGRRGRGPSRPAADPAAPRARPGAARGCSRLRWWGGHGRLLLVSNVGMVISRRRILPVGLGQGFEDPDPPRVLVGGDALLDERDDLGGVGAGAGFERDRGADLLAEALARDAEHGGLRDGGVLVDDLLDLAGVDVEPAADYQVLLAVHDGEAAVGVDGPMSPVANQPSHAIAAAVSSGRFQ